MPIPTDEKEVVEFLLNDFIKMLRKRKLTPAASKLTPKVVLFMGRWVTDGTLTMAQLRVLAEKRLEELQ